MPRLGAPGRTELLLFRSTHLGPAVLQRKLQRAQPIRSLRAGDPSHTAALKQAGLRPEGGRVHLGCGSQTKAHLGAQPAGAPTDGHLPQQCSVTKAATDTRAWTKGSPQNPQCMEKENAVTVSASSGRPVATRAGSEVRLPGSWLWHSRAV